MLNPAGLTFTASLRDAALYGNSRQTRSPANIRIWCKAEDCWELKFALAQGVKEGFDAKGISIPYPHTVEIRKQG